MLRDQAENSNTESVGNLISNLTILLIEDSETDTYTIRRILSSHMRHPCCVVHTDSMASAESILKERDDIDLILLDLGLPDTTDNNDTFDRMSNVKERIPVIILTSLQDHAFALNTLKEGAEDYVLKSALATNPEIICDAIDFAVCRHKRIEEIQEETEHDLEEKDMVIRWMSGDYNCTGAD